MYYGDTVLDNDVERFEQSRASRKAARGWRFRHLESRGTRFLRAVADRVRKLLSERPSRKKPAARPVRERLSY